MPKQTFFNLPEKKREKITEVIKNEFSETLYSDVSINKIIKDAGIPRGSFYQYFEDKRDMLFFILDDFIKIFCVRAVDSVISSQGNIFTFCHTLIDNVADMSQDVKQRILFRKLFSDTSVLNEAIEVLKSSQIKNMFSPQNRFLSYIDRSKLNLSTDEDYDIFLRIILDSLISCLMDYVFCEDVDIPKVKSMCHKRIDFLSQAYEKKPNNEKTSKD